MTSQSPPPSGPSDDAQPPNGSPEGPIDPDATLIRGPLPPDPAEPAVRFEITAQLAGRKSPMRMHTAVDPVKGFSFKPA